MKDFFELDLQVREYEKNQPHFLEFETKPLVQGFGTTLGNSLRRVLLTSILGAAIYAFRVEGVEQEFSNLPGCSENVVKIGLNIQKVIVKVDHKVFPNEREKITLELNVKGIKKVLAGDIKLPEGVQIVNPDQEIVNIVEKNKTLVMELFVVQGRGFSNFQDNKILTEGEIGLFTVSSNFSHVQRVSFQVEEIKVGQLDVSERLVLGVQTNGAIDPVNALVNAAQILISHLNFFVQLDKKSLTDFHFKSSKERESTSPRIEIKSLDFSERVINSLASSGIKFLDELSKKKRSELSRIANFGQKSLKEVVDKLKKDYKIALEE